MSKINISFNNKNYAIDESSLSSANALKSHLSSVMNGTGATINFGGVLYNVDSAKLSAARNAFVSHLGTISGSGYKVLVDGVEYGVDSTKVADSIATLHTVLGGLQSGGNDVGSTRTVIFPEQTVEGFEANESMGGTFYADIFSPVNASELVVGEEYIVAWDGNEYNCVALDASEMSSGTVVLGNLSQWGGTGNGEPFIVVYRLVNDSGMTYIPYYGFHVMDGSTATTHTVAIYKVN